MRRISALILVLVLLLAMGTPVIGAAPALQGVRAVITSPSMNAVVRGRVLINGSAAHPNFWKYEVHMAREPNPSGAWNVLGVHETQVVDGVLETWDTGTVPDGSYSLRLRVVDKTGNYQEYFVRQISVANAQPTETPTPASTATPRPPSAPTATAMAIQTIGTATVAISQPTVDLAASTPTPTLVRPTARPALSVPSINVGEWKDAFLMGAGAMAAIFVLVGLIYLIRRIL